MLTSPPDDAIVWRYTDLSRFCSLLANGLWFQRLDLLDDPQEGGFTDGELRWLSDQRPEHSANIAQQFSEFRRTHFVNCWSRQPNESAVLWKLFGVGVGGVALKSTVGRLRLALALSGPNISFGEVTYTDWNVYRSPGSNYRVMTFRKSESFIHESEVRMLFQDPTVETGAQERVLKQPYQVDPGELATIADGITKNLLREAYPAFKIDEQAIRRAAHASVVSWYDRFKRREMACGIPIAVEIAALADEIVVGPQNPDWVIGLVQDIVARHGPSLAVRRSSLVKAPSPVTP